MAAAVITPTAPTAPAAPANTALFAKPGESILDYETRLGTTNTAAGDQGTGTGFGTPAPIDPTLVPKSQGGSGPELPGSSGASGAPAAAAAPSANDKLAQSLGYKDWNDAITQLTAPSQDTTDFYNNAYAAAGLGALQTQITNRQNDLANASANVDDNPWLDEASRVGRQNTLQTLANNDIKNWQSQYDAGLKQVNQLVSNNAKDVSATQASNKAKLAFLEAQAKASATASTKAPTTIKGADGSTYQYDPASGTFTQILPGKSASASGGAKTPVPPASPTGTGPQFNSFNFTATQLGALNAKGLNQDHANQILGEIKQGYTLDDIRQQMRDSGIDPGLLDTIMLYVDPAHNTPAKTSSSPSSGRTL